MLALLAVIACLVAGFVFFSANGPQGLDAIPPLWTAVAVTIVLGLFYIVLARNTAMERRRPFAAIVGSVVAAAGAAIYFIQPRTPIDTFALGPASDGRTALSDTTAGPHSVRLRLRTSGQFIARAEVNGTGIDLIVDTGASSVILKHADAEKAGIDTSSLAYTSPIATANGTALTAPVRLRSISVGAVRIEAVDALVAKPGSVNESLLGMSFLRRLRSYDIAGDFLTLRQ